MPTGMPELLAHLVDRVVARVVRRHLRRERHDAHHAERRVLRELAQALDLAPGSRRIADAARDEEAARMRVADVEQLVGVAVEAAGEDAGRDAELVHDREQRVDADRTLVAPEVAGDVLVALLRHELLPRTVR